MSVGESNGVSMLQNLGSPSPFAATDGSTTTYNPLMQPIPTSTSPTPSYINPSSVKRPRGRPRKHSLEGSANHGIISPPPPQGADVAAVKKGRGRPRGSGRKQQVAYLGSEAAGFGFRPHVITIKAGEDVLAKLMSFSQSTSQAVCVLSANGSISNVSLWQAATSGGTVTYEGRFEILTLSGSFLLSESGGQRSRTGGLSVSLAGPDGRVLGGGVAGLLTAAASVQVIVGSFRTEGQRQLKSGNSDAFGTPATFVSGASAARSPPSLGTLSESSGGPVSAHNQLVETSNSSPSGVANLPWR
ncbi:AT-hook motif nuclear-localized protein 10-like isoform X2 [Lycium ferocissimum]|uniref:AT-hook motif nuclear-localized protein 10-like isoform X2 n=1 Tax=Lycium ferocissimum TaxID=112874 RepID=UPI0028157AE2|nr:AT-hook motif nuclear-localized protein 10-like isoform X2 [Lycium ferocissimum]